MKVWWRAVPLLLLLARCAAAQQLIFELDPARSGVEFTLGATLHTVHGTLRVKSGWVQFDPATGAARGEIVVDATSAQTGNEGRDRKMHKEVLESARYPEIRLTVQKVRGSLPANGEAQLRVGGVFAVHGIERPVDLAAPTRVHDGSIASDVEVSVPYVGWGMKDPSTFFLRVDKRVEVIVHAVGRLRAAP